MNLHSTVGPFSIEGVARERFEAVEAKRQHIGLPVSRLCRAADISENAYHRLRKHPARQPNFRTVTRLEEAISGFGNAGSGSDGVA